MMLHQKIKAGALQYVLVISIIIGILIFAFISLIYLQERMTIKHNFTKEAISNTQMGFDYFKENEVPYNEKMVLPFIENALATTTIEKQHWGLFDLAIVTSKVKNEFFQKVGLLGTENSKKEALYLKDNNQSLVLVGETTIIGNVSVPKQGVKSGTIAGDSYYGNQLIYGSQKRSAPQLPEIKNIAHVKDFYSNYVAVNTEDFELKEDLKMQQSFKEKTLLYEATNTINLEHVVLSGNILIISKSAINVAASAVLEDVILMAPKIRIASNVKGNFQAIATKNIEVGVGCNLSYPTALVLLDPGNTMPNNKKQKEEPKITIKKNTAIKGMLVFKSNNIGVNYNAQISIQENVNITGEVYCSKNLELQGSVFGAVYTSNFIVKKSGGIYSNHLYNGAINSKKLPKQYAGLQINKASNAVAKWVN